jgi:nucleoside-diphosphate-sugar epimerase
MQRYLASGDIAMHPRNALCHTVQHQETTSMSTSIASLHVIVGAGQIGTQLAQRLVSLGHRVRVVARSEATPVAGIERIRGSIADPAVARSAGEGAAVVYQCANPPYSRWQTDLPPIIEGTLTAARVNRARIVALDNLYAFGRMGGAPMRPEGPFAPCSRKGALRLRLQQQLLEAHTRGDCEVAIGKASDFVGPGVVTAHLGERFMQRIFAGKAGECMGDPALPHAFTYAPDVVEALVTLATQEGSTGRVWHIPTGEAVSMQHWAEALGRVIQRDVRVSTLPAWVVRMIGVFVADMGELVEMRYQWEEAYRVDDSAFREQFKMVATPFETQVRETAKWAIARYGSGK